DQADRARDGEPGRGLVPPRRRLGRGDPLQGRPEDEGVEEHRPDEDDGRVDVDDQGQLVDDLHPCPTADRLSGGHPPAPGSGAASTCSSPLPRSTPSTAGKLGQAHTNRAGSSWGLWWQRVTPGSRTGITRASPSSHSKHSPSTSVVPRPSRKTIISPPCQR